MAFLHAIAPTSKLLQKAFRKEKQNHLAQILQDLKMTRLKSEPHVYMTENGKVNILVYVDDLLFIGQDDITNEMFTAIQEHLMLRSTGELSMGQTISPQGRGITNKGDHYEISLSKDYTTTMLEEAGMTTYETATTPGTAANKAINNDNENILGNKEERALYRLIGKTPTDDIHETRPELCQHKS